MKRRGVLLNEDKFNMLGKSSLFRARTADARGGTRKALIMALARKLLVALWRLVTTGEVRDGVVLRPAL
jgi:transposase